MWGRYSISVWAFLLKGNLHWLVNRGWIFVLGMEIRVACGVDTEFPYRVRIVDMGLIAATVCRHSLRFSE